MQKIRTRLEHLKRSSSMNTFSHILLTLEIVIPYTITKSVMQVPSMVLGPYPVAAELLSWFEPKKGEKLYYPLLHNLLCPSFRPKGLLQGLAFLLTNMGLVKVKMLTMKDIMLSYN